MAFQYNHYYEIYNGGKYVNLNGDHENNVVNNGEKVTMYAARTIPISVGRSNVMAAIIRCGLFFSVVAVGMP